jgi:biotin transport system substrate-specific component
MRPVLRPMILAALLAALTGAAARFSLTIPAVSSVPFTLQVLLVLLAGGLLGSTWGAAAMALYVLLGAVGLPVYAGGKAGLGVLLGPTGGYLFSYPLAALVTGLLAPPGRRPGTVRTGLAMLAGLCIIYLGGAGWAVLTGGKALGVVISGWVLPFIPVDLLKTAVAAWLSVAVNRALVAAGYRHHAYE